MKGMEADDANAIHSFGCYYYNEELGFPQSYDKALELWHRAGELGCDESYYNIGHSYFFGKVWKGMQRRQSIFMSWQLLGEMKMQGTILAISKKKQAIWLEH